eukprot:1297585-Alexandrium_andersonii.AAC.1
MCIRDRRKGANSSPRAASSCPAPRRPQAPTGYWADLAGRWAPNSAEAASSSPIHETRTHTGAPAGRGAGMSRA